MLNASTVRRRHAIKQIGVLVSFRFGRPSYPQIEDLNLGFENLHSNEILGGRMNGANNANGASNANGSNNANGIATTNANGIGCMISGVCRCEQGLSRYIGKLRTDFVIDFLFQHIKIRLRVILGVSRYAHRWNAVRMKFGMNAEWPVKQHAVRILAAIKHLKLVVALQSVSQDVNVPKEQSTKELKVF